jgi:hypothetical protein
LSLFSFTSFSTAELSSVLPNAAVPNVGVVVVVPNEKADLKPDALSEVEVEAAGVANNDEGVDAVALIEFVEGLFTGTMNKSPLDFIA